MEAVYSPTCPPHGAALPWACFNFHPLTGLWTCSGSIALGWFWPTDWEPSSWLLVNSQSVPGTSFSPTPLSVIHTQQCPAKPGSAGGYDCRVPGAY